MIMFLIKQTVKICNNSKIKKTRQTPRFLFQLKQPRNCGDKDKCQKYGVCRIAQGFVWDMLCKEAVDGLPMENDVQHEQHNDNYSRPEVDIYPGASAHTHKCHTAADNLIKQVARATYNSHRGEQQHINNDICLEFIHSLLMFVAVMGNAAHARVKHKTC